MCLRQIFRSVVVTAITMTLIGCSSIEAPTNPATVGPTCAIQEPPIDAGEFVSGSRLQKVYPRRTDISSTFRGCQSSWAQDEHGWKLVYRLVLIDGMTKMLVSNKLECAYDKGILSLGSHTECPKTAPGLVESLPPGCLNSFQNPPGYPCSESAKTPSASEINSSSKRPGASDVVLTSCSINDIVLFGVIQQFGERKALLRCPGSSIHMTRVGTYVGREAAKLTQIKDSEIVVSDAAGNEKQIVENRPLVKPQDKPPKKVKISPSTTDIAYLMYYESVRLKIEKLGTINFPRKDGKSLYGRLTVWVPISRDGSIYVADGGPRVKSSSGNADLDRAALRIVRRAAPFVQFPSSHDRKLEGDVWELFFPFNFTNDDAGERVRVNAETGK